MLTRIEEFNRLVLESSVFIVGMISIYADSMRDGVIDHEADTSSYCANTALYLSNQGIHVFPMIERLDILELYKLHHRRLIPRHYGELIKEMETNGLP